ncbi:MAG: hypothetical protein KDB01_07550 [Planctomycetaceae bacterium]|nr:hypothetical protein [Planctomycetaceae bacterium]
MRPVIPGVRVNSRSWQRRNAHCCDEAHPDLLLLVSLAAIVLQITCGCSEVTENSVTHPIASESSQQALVSANDSARTRERLPETAEFEPREGKEKAAESTVPASETVESTTADVAPTDAAPSANKELTVSAERETSDGNVAVPEKAHMQPTAAQLARWTRKEFAPLQLLACQDSEITGFVSALAATKDGRHFILAGTKITLWSVSGEAPEHVFLETKDDQTIKSLAVSPNGKWFAAGDSGGTIRLWSLEDRSELVSKKLYSTGITQIAISPDSKEIATISYDDEITIRSADSLQERKRFNVYTKGTKRIEYMTPELLVAAGETTSSWNVSTGEHVETLSPGRYQFTLARSFDGDQFLFGDNELLKFRNIPDQKDVFSLQGEFANDELATFSGSGELLATANGATLRIWDLTTNRLQQVIDVCGWPIRGISWLPETNALVVASENGRTRIWGTSHVGDNLQLSPLHAPVTTPDETRHAPATPAQLLQTMDLRTFPRISDDALKVSNAFSIIYETTASPEEAEQFYRFQLNQAGWREAAADITSAGTIRFENGGFMILASCYTFSGESTSVNVNLTENYDLRQLPKFDQLPIEIYFENADTVTYRTKAELWQIEASLLRKLHDAGWTAYSRLHSAQADIADGRIIQFLRGGTTLFVSIGRFQEESEDFSIQYSLALTANAVPIPPDSGFVEFDGATQPFLVGTTELSLKEAGEFYDKELAAEGWLAREFGRSHSEDQIWLPYIQGQREVTVGLIKLPTGKTLIRIGKGLETASWQLAKPVEADSSNGVQSGIEAADFPILNESKATKIDAVGKVIEFSMDDVPLPKVAELYTEKLQSSGWMLDGSGITSDDYVFLTFVKDKFEIALRGRVTDGNSFVNVQGDGLLWTKPLPNGRKVVPYETWLRLNHHPATLNLLDQFQAEMRSISEAGPTAEKEN